MTVAERLIEQVSELELDEDCIERVLSRTAVETIQRDYENDDSTVYIFEDGSGICDNWADRVAFTAEEAADYV
jgi:hypothetical protein